MSGICILHIYLEVTLNVEEMMLFSSCLDTKHYTIWSFYRLALVVSELNQHNSLNYQRKHCMSMS